MPETGKALQVAINEAMRDLEKNASSKSDLKYARIFIEKALKLQTKELENLISYIDNQDDN